jgi:23S rRNA (guanosine2251-2'-O)-methyltransferase
LSNTKKNNLIIGRKPLLEAFANGKTIDVVFMQKGISGESIEEIRAFTRQHKVPIKLVPIEKLNGITRANHQGVLAFTTNIVYQELQDVIDLVLSKGETPLFVMLDGVTDVRNIGAIARSAVCCGAQALIIPDKGVGALNEEANKSAAGALEIIHVCRVGSLLKAIDTLHLNGIAVYTSEMKAAKKLHELDWTSPCCFVMGSEEKGVQSFMLKAADEYFTIPMSGNFDSFNVSVAAGIICYQAMMQRISAQ